MRIKKKKKREETEQKAEREKLSNGEILQIPTRDVFIIASICCRKFCSPTRSVSAHLSELVAENHRKTSWLPASAETALLLFYLIHDECSVPTY